MRVSSSKGDIEKIRYAFLAYLYINHHPIPTPWRDFKMQAFSRLKKLKREIIAQKMSRDTWVDPMCYLVTLLRPIHPRPIIWMATKYVFKGLLVKLFHSLLT